MALTKEEAEKAMMAEVQKAYDAIKAAEKLADEHKLSFGFDLAYGMGGHYYGDPEDRYDSYGDYSTKEEIPGWHPSSQSC